jgi:hypothetical protein
MLVLMREEGKTVPGVYQKERHTGTASLRRLNDIILFPRIRLLHAKRDDSLPDPRLVYSVKKYE